MCLKKHKLLQFVPFMTTYSRWGIMRRSCTNVPDRLSVASFGHQCIKFATLNEKAYIFCQIT